MKTAIAKMTDKTKSLKNKNFLGFKEDQIICGDALKYLKNIPDKSVDLVIADPPYNLSKGSKINFNNKGVKGFGGEWNKVMEDWDNMPFYDYLKFTFEWLAEIKRVLKPTGSVWVFGTYHNIGLINLAYQALGIEIINEVIWYKRNAFPNLAGRRLTASHETLLWGHTNSKKREYYFDYKKSKEYSDPLDLMKAKDKQMRTVWDIPNNKEAREIAYGKHPTQKPLSVCKRIISISSKPGDIVLVPFAGAGSECLAAKELGRHFLGFELDQKYIDIANKRILAFKNTETLF
jgi:site-specific DNA-methyltransferase (adenine-specific)